jgi:acetyltransferase
LICLRKICAHLWFEKEFPNFLPYTFLQWFNIERSFGCGINSALWFNSSMDTTLLAFFQPRGIVVVGASTSAEKLGYGVARNLVLSGYRGAIHFVGQKEAELFGYPLHTDLASLPDPLDLAVLIVPPVVTPQMLEACGKRGIRAAIIVSSGFRESGAEGATLERTCLQIARAHGMRLLGPNCIGIIDTHLPLDTTFLQPPMPAPGGIGFISHSGAFAASIVDWAREEGFGFSQIVSLGNQADVNETEMLAALVEDPHTKVIALYMESVSDGRRFVDTARQVTQHKAVIALKAGRFESGQKAAASHTGALAASDTAFEAAFAKARILRAETAEQMFDWARALERSPLPRGKRIAILTNAGGPGVIAADALEMNNLVLAQLTESTLKELSAILPPSAALHNPVDMLASASPETYAACLSLLLADPGVDAALVILPPPPMFKAQDVAERLVKVISQSDKAVVVALMGSTLVHEAANTFEDAGVPFYPFPERAVSALGALVRRAELLQRETQTAPSPASFPAPPANFSAESLLEHYQIPVAPVRLARSEAEAAAIARELGYPLVMKVASPDILHKSDVGGVRLGIQDLPSLLAAYAQMLKHISTLKPQAQIDGVFLQRQAPEGQEVIAGMVRDPQFGPLMMFGSGGVEVEGLKDVAFALAPLSQSEAEEMIRKTWAGRKLKGFRSIPPADEKAVIDVLVKLSRLALENESITEIEINPLRVWAHGAIAVDVRMR